MKLGNNSFSQKLRDTKFDFMKSAKYVIGALMAIIFAGILVLSFIGFNLGMDFAGGTIINVVVENVNDDDVYENAKQKINEVLNEKGIKASLFQYSDTSNGEAISVRYIDKSGLNETEMEALNKEVVDLLFDKFGYDQTDFEQKNFVMMSERIGARTSSDLLLFSLLAILLAIVFMLAYIAIRFEFASGAAAIIALLQDVLVMCALVLVFRVQVNSTFIAALITIIGYSINNTIVIFDRIRENCKNEKFKDKKRTFIANISVKETLSRTVLTTITTLATISLLLIFGESSIKEFSLPIVFGLLSGFLSSVFTAPFFWTLGFSKPSKVKNNDASESVVEFEATKTEVAES